MKSSYLGCRFWECHNITGLRYRLYLHVWPNYWSVYSIRSIHINMFFDIGIAYVTSSFEIFPLYVFAFYLLVFCLRLISKVFSLRESCVLYTNAVFKLHMNV